jgi:Rrf2 family protein
MGNSRYTVAIHTMLLLEEPEDGYITSDWIAGSVNTNAVVIRRILGALMEAGLVEGAKGQGGGYRLARDRRGITLWDVYQAVNAEGPFELHTNEPNQRCPIGNRIQRHLCDVYQDAENAMKEVLDGVTIEVLRQRVMGAEQKRRVRR